MKIFQTKIVNNSNPIGLDYEIFSIQLILSQLKWLQTIFGIAHIQTRRKSEGEAMSMQESGYRGSTKYLAAYPQGSFDGLDYDLSFDDSYASKIFFLCKDSININPKADGWEYTRQTVEIEQPIVLLLHCSLNALEIATYEQIKLDILYQLNQCPKIKGTMMYENMDNVYKEFTLTPEINGCTRYPFYVLRVEFTLSWQGFGYNGANVFTPSI